VAWHAPDVAKVPLPVRLTPGVGDFVGRVAERELLLQAYKQTENRTAQLVVVVGEPGIGKSRLIHEAAAKMYETGAVVLAGRCEQHLGGPFQPWVGALAHLIAHLPHDVVAEHLAEHGHGIATVVPDVGRRHPAMAVPVRLDAGFERHRLFEAIAALLHTAAADLPLVILLDDLQWADVPSLQLLRHLLRVAPPAPILLIGTYRDTDLDHSPLAETLVDLRRDDLFIRVLLHGLSQEELDEFVATRLAHSPRSDFVNALFVETDGNPFLAGEVLADLVETNAIGDLEHLSPSVADRARRLRRQPGRQPS
jgi:predicted ATPase